MEHSDGALRWCEVGVTWQCFLQLHYIVDVAAAAISFFSMTNELIRDFC